MLSAEATTTGSEPDLESVLRLLVKNFSVAPLANGKRMRDLLNMDREAFRIASISVLREEMDVRGCRYLVTLLWTHELLIAALSDVSIPKTLSLEVARTAAKVDPQLHIRLIRFLVTGMIEGQELEENAAARLLEILSHITDAVGIQPFLRQMLLHPNGRIRSKVTLLVGRGQAGLRALEKLTADDDPRVRANAIEALWANRDAHALAIFRESLKDVNNRVIGNSVLGLYMAGDVQAVREAIALASHESAVFRATGAWIMGKMKDPRFLPHLGRLLADSRGQLRKSVFGAVESIKKSMASRLAGPGLRVRIMDVKDSEPSVLQVQIAIGDPSLKEMPDIKPTDVLISAGRDQVVDYACQEQKEETPFIGFVLPRRTNIGDPLRIELEGALKSCLRTRRRGEQWNIIRYREDSKENLIARAQLFGESLQEARLTPHFAGAPSAFTTNLAALQTAIETPGLRFETGLALPEAMHNVMTPPVPARAARHLIVLVHGHRPVSAHSFESLTSAAASSRSRIHVVSIDDNPELRQVCETTSGVYRTCSDVTGLGDAIGFLCLWIRRSYSLEFKLPYSEAPADISVQINTTLASGEDTWSLVQTARHHVSEQEKFQSTIQ